MTSAELKVFEAGTALAAAADLFSNAVVAEDWKQITALGIKLDCALESWRAAVALVAEADPQLSRERES